MLYEEFEAITGMQISFTEYEAIESFYNHGGAWMDKHEFCEWYMGQSKKAKGLLLSAGKAMMKKTWDLIDAHKEAKETLERHQKRIAEIDAADRKLVERIEGELSEAKRRVADLTAENAELKRRLELGMEWTVVSTASNLHPDTYEKMAGEKGRNVITMEEAAARVADEFGFDEERIEILQSVEVAEENQYGEIRTGERARLPVWESTDSHYIRFNVRVKGGVRGYEAIDGELMIYGV